ncbi:TraR/DksA family transcriptional regulator, partial [Nocardiopsis alba]
MKVTQAARLPVRAGESPWTPEELAEVRGLLEIEIEVRPRTARLRPPTQGRTGRSAGPGRARP